MRELRRRSHEVLVCEIIHSEIENYIQSYINKYQQVRRMFEEHDFDYVEHEATHARLAKGEN